YYARPQGSTSKLNTWRDGLRILITIVGLYRSERPLAFFSALGIVLAIASVGLAIPIFVTYFEQGIVPRIPTAILSTGLMLLASLSIVAGLVLDTVTRGRRETKLIAYLEQAPPGEEWRRWQGGGDGGASVATNWGTKISGASSCAPTMPCWSRRWELCSMPLTSPTWCSTRT